MTAPLAAVNVREGIGLGEAFGGEGGTGTGVNDGVHDKSNAAVIRINPVRIKKSFIF
jgi:hypothetical protein